MNSTNPTISWAMSTAWASFRRRSAIPSWNSPAPKPPLSTPFPRTTTLLTSLVLLTKTCSAQSIWCNCTNGTLLNYAEDTRKCPRREWTAYATWFGTCSSSMSNCASSRPPFAPSSIATWTERPSFHPPLFPLFPLFPKRSINRSSSASPISTGKSALARSITYRHRNSAVSSSPPPNRSQRSNGTPSPYHSQWSNQLIFPIGAAFEPCNWTTASSSLEGGIVTLIK